MEASRTHGSFDTRWPCALRRSSTARPGAPDPHGEAAETLDRDAYAAYERGRQPRTTPPQLSVVRTERPQAARLEQEREKAGTERLLAAMAARRAIHDPLAVPSEIEELAARRMQKYGVTAEQAAGGSPDVASLLAGGEFEEQQTLTVVDRVRRNHLIPRLTRLPIGVRCLPVPQTGP